MDYLEFNPEAPTIMHLDLNSCFATIEQQANPLLRGKPIAVAAYVTGAGCILAPSVEAKKFGVKTGMRVREGKLLCPNLIVLPPDPWKYRNVHLALKKILSVYTFDFSPKSIDEFVLNMKDYLPVLSQKVTPCEATTLKRVALEIKARIKKEIGEWLTVSVGISTNRFLAKIAVGLHKPDGLDEINKDNYLKVYADLRLTDLTGIKGRNVSRLNSIGIFTVLDFLKGSPLSLKAAFKSINAYYWYLRLRGWEIDNVVFARHSYGNSYALPKPLVSVKELSPILSKLVEKMGARLRRAGYKARGVHLAIWYRDGGFWHHGVAIPNALFDSRDFFKEALRILVRSPYKKPVRNLAVSVFNLVKSKSDQLELFDDVIKKKRLVGSVDKITERWGNFAICPARMLGTEKEVIDRIAFGGVKELEEFSLASKP